jgi:hypothetical protein
LQHNTPGRLEEKILKTLPSRSKYDREPTVPLATKRRFRDPVLERQIGLGADSEEKHEPVSDIDTAAADSLKVLDPKWPIREADVACAS